MRRGIILITLVACGGAVALGVALTSHSSSPGARGYQSARLHMVGDTCPNAVYVPVGRRGETAMPLVVVLHGCNTTPAQQAGASRYDELAQQHRFVVLYPDVDNRDEANGGCWQGL